MPLAQSTMAWSPASTTSGPYRWILTVVDDLSRARQCRAVLRRSPKPISADILENPDVADLVDACSQRRDDPGARRVVIAVTNPTGWAVAVGISSLRQRLHEKDNPLVMLVTDVPDELLPVHISDYPRLHRLNLGGDLTGTILELLR